MYISLRVTVISAALLSGQKCIAQTTDTAAMIDSKQNSIAQLAPLYGINLSHGMWIHQEAPVCPLFTSHSFSRYERTSVAGGISSFIVIYPNDTGTHAKNVAEKQILLIPIAGDTGRAPQPPFERPSTVVAFNRILKDELQANGSAMRSTDGYSEKLAECYMRIAGLQPQASSKEETGFSSPSKASNPVPQSVLTPVAGLGNESAYIEFDASGMIKRATLVKSEASRQHP